MTIIDGLNRVSQILSVSLGQLSEAIIIAFGATFPRQSNEDFKY